MNFRVLASLIILPAVLPAVLLLRARLKSPPKGPFLIFFIAIFILRALRDLWLLLSLKGPLLLLIIGTRDALSAL